MRKRIQRGLWGGIAALSAMSMGFGIIRLVDRGIPTGVAVSFLVVGVGLLVLFVLCRSKWMSNEEG